MGSVSYSLVGEEVWFNYMNWIATYVGDVEVDHRVENQYIQEWYTYKSEVVGFIHKNDLSCKDKNVYKINTLTTMFSDFFVNFY